MNKVPLLGMTLSQLQGVAAEIGLPRFAAKQMAQWLYAKHADSIAQMTNLSLRHREALAQHYEVGSQPPTHCMRSVDGTAKYLFPAGEGRSVEAVYIPDGERATLCVSSQVGCKMNCRFCMTGHQGFHGQLTAGQIINQIRSLPERDRLTNLVFMGMGEPLDNLDAVLSALEIITSDYGYGWSPRRITVSTVGIRRGLARFVGESQCHLAVSLHSPIHQQRLSLMPAEGAYPIAEVVDLLRQSDFSGQRRLSFEYIVFRDVNDSLTYARELLRLLRGIDCRINLIRFHSIPDTDLEGADEATMLAFRDYLTHHGLFATLRASRGEDIFAACGMLSTAKGKA